MVVEVGGTTKGNRFAWVSLGFAAWLIGGVASVGWALRQGRATDVGWSPYHIPGYTGLLALVVFCLVRVARARTQGHGWRTAFPPGYGVLVAGAAVLVTFLVVDIGWREGVGITPGIEDSLAPSRLLLATGLILVAVAPLHAALGIDALTTADRWAATCSGALTLSVLWISTGFHPAQAPWLERASDSSLARAEVWRMNADGTGQTRTIMSVDGTEASGPAWSPDGTRFAYTLAHTRVDGDEDLDIWKADADGSRRSAVVAGPDWDWIPRWSPDGTWIVFTREARGGPEMASGPVPPEAGGGPLGPAFALEPTSLRQYADIWRVPADGSGPPERLTDARGDDRAASWSPDGRQLVFDSTRDGNTELYLMAADGSVQRRLAADPGEDWGATWSPDGTRIAFNSNRTGPMQIYTIRADGSDLRRLTHDDADTVTPAWSSDGSRIAYSRRGQDVEIWSMAADGSDPLDLSSSPASDDSVWGDAWSRTGQLVYTRSAFPPVTHAGLVRQDLAAAGVLISAAALALVTAAVALVGAPFGGFALMLGIATALAASAGGEWRFVIPGLVAGLAIDVLTRLGPRRSQVMVAATTSGGAFVATAAVAVATTTGLAWSTTLLVGLVTAGALVGLGIGLLVAVAHRGREDPTLA